MSGFASINDFADKAVSFDEPAPRLFGCTAEGDPNSVLVVDAQATPLMAAVVQRASAGGAGLKEVYGQAMAARLPKHGRWVILEHCMPFDVTRAHDEARGLGHPRIWTAERDVEMWRALEQGAAAPPADGAPGQR